MDQQRCADAGPDCVVDLFDISNLRLVFPPFTALSAALCLSTWKPSNQGGAKMGMDTPSSVSHPHPAAVEEGNQEMKRRQPNPGGPPLHRPMVMPTPSSILTHDLSTERGVIVGIIFAHSKSVRSSIAGPLL